MQGMPYEDTIRLLLQNKFERIENLVQMNHAATLAIPSVLVTIWGISLKFPFPILPKKVSLISDLNILRPD